MLEDLHASIQLRQFQRLLDLKVNRVTQKVMTAQTRPGRADLTHSTSLRTARTRILLAWTLNTIMKIHNPFLTHYQHNFMSLHPLLTLNNHRHHDFSNHKLLQHHSMTTLHILFQFHTMTLLTLSSSFSRSTWEQHLSGCIASLPLLPGENPKSLLVQTHPRQRSTAPTQLSLHLHFNHQHHRHHPPVNSLSSSRLRTPQLPQPLRHHCLLPLAYDRLTCGSTLLPLSLSKSTLPRVRQVE